MINTIFYYPDSLTFEEYQSRLNNNDIAARTIVFADAQKAIYKGGKQFGATSLSDLKTQIEQIFSEITNGTNGTNGHNGMDGLIKTIFDSVTNIRASKNDYGIVKVGDGINVVDGVISVDFSNVDLSEINDDITSLKASVALHTNAITDLTGRLSSAEATLTTKANASDITSLSNRVGTTESTLTDLSAQTTLYARSLTDLTNRVSSAETGLQAKANASSVYSKSEIDGKISTINSVISNLSGGADIDLSAITDLENEIATVKASLSSKADASSVYSKSYIDDKFSSVETTLSALGASSGVDTSAITDLINRISTAESTLQSKANASETYTKTEVDGKISTVETQMTNLGSSSGLSNTAITDLKNRMSSAESSLTSKANASNVYTKTEIDGKFTAVNATLETLGAESGVDTSAITDLTNRIAAAETTLQSKANSNNVYTKTEIDGKITTINSSISANSGLKTAADVKSAFDDINETIYTSGTASATLFAKIESDADAKYAGIDVAVRKVNVGTSANPNYQLESGVTVSADNIDFTANNFSIDASQIKIGNVSMFSIDSTGSYSIDFYGSLGIFANGTGVIESISPSDYDGGSINIHQNRLIIGSYSSGSYNLSGLIASNVMLAGIVDANQVVGHKIVGNSMSIQGSGKLVLDPGSYDQDHYIDSLNVYIPEGTVTAADIVAESITLNGSGSSGELTYNNSSNAIECSSTLRLIDSNSNYGTLELEQITFSDAHDTNSLTYNGSSDELSCGANLSVSGNGYCGGNLRVNGTVAADNFVVQTGTNTTASGWSGTIVVDGNTLTFTGGILTAASGNGVTVAS